MAFCFKCGTWADDDAAFCSSCGTELNPHYSYASTKPEPKVWRVFARLGDIFGLIGFIGSFIPFVCFATLINTCIPGIIFSTIGKKSTRYYETASEGLTLSIYGLIISIIMTIMSFLLVS